MHPYELCRWPAFAAIFPIVLALSLPPCALIRADWPQFRGPSGQGVVGDAPLPTHWSERDNVRFKVAVPGHGWSSPVIADDEIWLSTATEEGRSLRALCFHRDDGRLLHNVELFRRATAESVHTQNGHASPTPIIEGKTVYFHFGPSGTAAVDRQGAIRWRVQTLGYETPHGSASSPVLADGLLLICGDGSDRQFLAALDCQTGEILWQHSRAHLEEARRKSRAEANPDRKGLPFISFSTPLVIAHPEGAALVSTPADHVVANRVADGRELWWMPYNCFSLVARPVFGHGLVYAVGGLRDGHYALYAISATASGQVTGDTVDAGDTVTGGTAKGLVWSHTTSVPQVPSPVLVDDVIVLVKDNGVVTCLDAFSGRLCWQHRLGGNYRASPIAQQDLVYALNQAGKMSVFRAGQEFQLVASNQLDGIFLASPAVSGRSLILRSDRHLYRIEVPQN